MMLIFIGLIGSLTGISSREIRPVKPMPAISNSLVNFGKMDISFYLSDKFKDALAKQDSFLNPPSSFFSSLHNPSPIEEPCPCSSLRHMKDPFASHPSEILNKILMSNDLFSFNKELLSSTLCCDSHENIHEEGVFFEFSPKQNQMVANPMQTNPLVLPSITSILENVFPRKPSLPVESIKPSAIDIFLLPSKKPLIGGAITPFLKKKPNIHAVGDNEIKEDTKTINFIPAFSVKKDLGDKKPVQETTPHTESNNNYSTNKLNRV